MAAQDSVRMHSMTSTRGETLFAVCLSPLPGSYQHSQSGGGAASRAGVDSVVDRKLHFANQLSATYLAKVGR